MYVAVRLQFTVVQGYILSPLLHHYPFKEEFVNTFRVLVTTCKPISWKDTNFEL